MSLKYEPVLFFLQVSHTDAITGGDSTVSNTTFMPSIYFLTPLVFQVSHADAISDGDSTVRNTMAHFFTLLVFLQVSHTDAISDGDSTVSNTTFMPSMEGPGFLKAESNYHAYVNCPLEFAVGKGPPHLPLPQ